MNYDIETIRKGLPYYNKIMLMVNTDEFCGDNFRKIFNRFYKLRQRPAEWYDTYYSIFRDCKDNNPGFSDVLNELYNPDNFVYQYFNIKIKDRDYSSFDILYQHIKQDLEKAKAILNNN